MQLVSWQELESDYLARAQGALRRDARTAWAALVEDLMPWSLIANAATFNADEVGFGISRTSALRRFERFFESARRQLRRPVEGFMACEVGPAGGLEHGHGLMALGGGLRQGDISQLSAVWRSVPGNGFIRLEPAGAIGWFARYASKHTVKQLGDVVFSPGCGRRWYEGWGPGEKGA